MVAVRESVFEDLPKPAYSLNGRIAAFEAAAGVLLPEAYKRVIGDLDGMLLKKGELLWSEEGSSPHYALVQAFLTFAQDGDEAVLTGVDEDDRGMVETYIRIFGMLGQLDRVKGEGLEGVIPFAIDDDDGLFCFDFRENVSPVPIIFLDSEYAMEESELCESFDEFLKALEAGDA